MKQMRTLRQLAEGIGLREIVQIDGTGLLIGIYCRGRSRWRRHDDVLFLGQFDGDVHEQGSL
ncbi:hypothetical protein AALP_AA5G149800 [Arabis alpina]|uniref:Uncharacterized protein n=1 Tax=Arabis alpina TaxID=50452 RepID=A0A087GX71_ARAAL|nr:hypothetical protein AALP_AA5G149800 [Arabis alpina]